MLLTIIFLQAIRGRYDMREWRRGAEMNARSQTVVGIKYPLDAYQPRGLDTCWIARHDHFSLELAGDAGERPHGRARQAGASRSGPAVL